jgi:hypothetical protein
VTEDALALAFRTGMPFVGLRDHAHDPDLDRLIPPDAARTARAIPLTADDDRVRLAVADPATDLSTLDRYLDGRQVELALAPREEIDTILGPPPPPAEAATEERGTQAAEHEGEPLVEAEADALTAEQPAPSDAAPSEPDSLTAEQPAPSDAAPSEPGSLAAHPEPHAVAVTEADPELAGEVPSWLEPRRRRWRPVLLTVLLVLVVLAAAAVIVLALANA